MTMVIVLNSHMVLLWAQQQAPSIGYMFPPGGQRGSSRSVILGGYDWTPDTQVFVHGEGFQLVLDGQPGPVIVPEPPYWFGKKARRSPFLMPRETLATLTIPANAKPGSYRWQVANANGASATGRFVVSELREVLERRESQLAQDLSGLPLVVSGQIKGIEEVDRYRVTAGNDGLMTLSLQTASIGSPLNAVVEVRDEAGSLVADGADTQGNDLQITFTTKADQPYLIRVYDLDFRGNRAFVYRLAVREGPGLVSAIPAAGRSGEQREVQFLGIGIASGSAKLESLTRRISFPSLETFAREPASFQTEIDTAFGESTPLELWVTEWSEMVEPQGANEQQRVLSPPFAVTGALNQRYGKDQYWFDAVKDELWTIDLRAAARWNQLDVAFSIHDSDGKELIRSDDSVGTTDAVLEWKVPADGRYQVTVHDISGNSGHATSTYRLAMYPAIPDFSISGPEFVNLPLGGKSTLDLKVNRYGGFDGEIELRVEELPSGITVTEPMLIPPGKKAHKLEFNATSDAGSDAFVLKLAAEANIDQHHRKIELSPVLLAIQMKPPFTIDAEGKNDVTKWPRGSTFPAPVLIQREDDFDGEIMLEMAARQGRHRQGIRGPELSIPPTSDRVLYPVFLPEWLETTRTSRMVVNGVAKLKDPTGKTRYLSTKLQTRIGFLPTGAMLKIDCPTPEIEVEQGATATIPVTLNRANGLDGPVVIDFSGESPKVDIFHLESIRVDDPGESGIAVPIDIAMDTPIGPHTLNVRATVLQNGLFPTISETKVLVLVRSSSNRFVKDKPSRGLVEIDSE